MGVRIRHFISRIRELITSSNERVLLSIFLLLNYIIITSDFFISYIKSPIVGGWDGSSHFAISKVYSDNVFPNIFGWIKNWYAGMPWPIGYPPLFHYSFAILDRLIPIESSLLFKLLFVFLALTLPILFFYIGKGMRIKNDVLYISTILFSIFTVSSYELFRQFGVTLDSTFKSGLYMQLFATSIMFVWIFLFTREKQGKLMFVITTLLQSAVILANLHVGEAMLIFWFGWITFELIKNRNIIAFLKKFISMLISFALISFWVFPLLETMQYFPGVAFASLNTHDLLAISAFIFFSITSLFIAHRKIDLVILRLLFIVLGFILVSVLPINMILPWLPLQPARLAVYVIIFSLFFIPYTILSIQKKYLPGQIPQLISMVLIVLVFFVFAKPTSGSIPEFYTSESDINLVHYLHDLEDGRSLIEVYAPWYPSHYNVAALAGVEEHETIWNVFRESSVSSTFIVPLRNSFSSTSESYGILCHLCEQDWEEFKDSDIEKKIFRSEIYGVRYFTAISKGQKEEFSSSKEFTLESSFGDWYVYSLDKMGDPLRNTKPVLLYTNFTSRDRQYEGGDSYNWLRYSEEWYLRADPEAIFVYADSTNENIKESFPLVVIDNLDSIEDLYRKNALAERQVIFYLEEKDADSELINMILQENKNIDLIIRTDDFKESYSQLIDQISPLLNHVKYPERYYYKFTNSSYYPYLIDNNGGEVYMSSPTISLIVSENEEYDIDFKLSTFAQVGNVISLISVGVLGFYLIIPYLSILLTSYKKESSDSNKD